MIDISPKCLEFFFVEIIIKRIVIDFGFMTIRNHIIKNSLIKYTLNESMYTVCYIFYFFRQRSKGIIFKVSSVSYNFV